MQLPLITLLLFGFYYTQAIARDDIGNESTGQAGICPNFAKDGCTEATDELTPTLTIETSTITLTKTLMYQDLSFSAPSLTLHSSGRQYFGKPLHANVTFPFFPYSIIGTSYPNGTGMMATNKASTTEPTLGPTSSLTISTFSTSQPSTQAPEPSSTSNASSVAQLISGADAESSHMSVSVKFLLLGILAWAAGL